MLFYLNVSSGRPVVGEIYVVASALTAAASSSSLAITAAVVEGGVDSSAQWDAQSKTFKQPPRAGRAASASASASASALVMGQNVTAFVSKGAYAYWSLDVSPGYELRCSLQARELKLVLIAAI